MQVRRNEDVLVSSLNLIVFTHVVTAVVYVTQDEINPAMYDVRGRVVFHDRHADDEAVGDITLL